MPPNASNSTHKLKRQNGNRNLIKKYNIQRPSKIVFNNTVKSEGKFIRNVLSKNELSNRGIHSTRSLGKLKGKPPFAPYNQQSTNAFNVLNTVPEIEYRKGIQNKTPGRGHISLKNKNTASENARIVANTIAAAAPNYDFKKMKAAVEARKNIDSFRKERIIQRIYEINGENDDDMEINLRFSKMQFF